MDLRAVLRFAESRGFGWLFIGLGRSAEEGGGGMGRVFYTI